MSTMGEEKKGLKISCRPYIDFHIFWKFRVLNYDFSIAYERPFGLVFNTFMCQSEQVVGMQEGLGTIHILRKHVWGAFLTIYPITYKY